MKKTLSITIGGLIYAIEDDAYEVLDRYLQAIKKQYADEPGFEEILADIETSIAEKFKEKISSHKQAITRADVEAVISVLGRPEEFADGSDESAGVGTNDNRRRDGAAGTDSAKEQTSPRRLFRNPDDVVIAGVCSGIAEYFGIDPVIVRVIFVIMALFNGIGIAIYLVLWISIPAAMTSEQKFQMRGKQTTIHEIKELAREKAKMMRDESSAAFEKIKQPNSRFRRFMVRLGDFIRQIFLALRNLFFKIWPIIGVVIGALISFAASLGIIGATVLLSILVFNIRSTHIFSDLPLAELAQQPLYYVGIIAAYFVIVIPFLIINLAGSTIARRKSMFRAVPTAAMLVVWSVALSAAVVVALDIIPWTANRIEERNKEQMVTRAYTYTDFDKLAVADTVSADITVVQGTSTQITFTGRSTDLDNLKFLEADHQLSISLESVDRGICLFCWDEPVRGEIILPKLTQLDVRDIGRATVMHATGSLAVSAQDVAGVNITDATLRDITIDQRDISRVTVAGSAQTLTAKLFDNARLEANKLNVRDAFVATQDIARATVAPTQQLSATSTDFSRVYYTTDPVTTMFKIRDNGRIASSTYNN